MNGQTQCEVVEHYKESLKYFDEKNIFFIALQGSQNYNLNTTESDVDTKLLVIPSFKDLVFNQKPISTTHVRSNNEHIDFKDVRLYFNEFRKQNINFIEVLFTKYYVLNTSYSEQFYQLRENREKIARYNPYIAVKAMEGMACEKFKNLYKEMPCQEKIVKEKGYSPKQLLHILRLEECLKNYIAEMDYEDMLTAFNREYLLDIKSGKYSLDEVRDIAINSLARIITTANEYCDKIENKPNVYVNELLNSIQYEIMSKYIYG